MNTNKLKEGYKNKKKMSQNKKERKSIVKIFYCFTINNICNDIFYN